jgi:hypothetical protein
LAEEVLVCGELDNRWAFTFCNRTPNLLSVKFDEEILVWMDWQWVLNTQQRKVRIKRSRSD